MNNYISHEERASHVLAWTSHCANFQVLTDEEGLDGEGALLISPVSGQFQRAPIRRADEHHQSLLTKALQSQSEEESAHRENDLRHRRRRRSITSTFSLASTTELTCETGITTPARTSSPSPRLPSGSFAPVGSVRYESDAFSVVSKDPAVQALEKKRCISFACAAKPKPDAETPEPLQLLERTDETPKAEAPKRTCISFACPARPVARSSERDLMVVAPIPMRPSPSKKDAVSSKTRSPSTVRSNRSSAPRPVPALSSRPITGTKVIRDDSEDESESSFHEFASEEPQEDDWIRNNDFSTKRKMTIDDTLEKENVIRKLGKEAEEEAELEAEEEEMVENGDDSLNADDAEDEDDTLAIDDDDESSGYGSDDVSEGYHTDNEIGFADSDDEDDDLVLWTTGITGHTTSNGIAPIRRPSMLSLKSDSTDSSAQNVETIRFKPRSIRPSIIRPAAPELPDSTDFVCGTLDEDRHLEEAYISCIEARKKEKLCLIPQDIDPSFPASEPEDEDEDDGHAGRAASDDHVWLHGELEDIHHNQDRVGRPKQTGQTSPKRCRSPPPKRLHSPPPKHRVARSPKGFSPKGLRPSPMLPTLTSVALQSPETSPIHTDADSTFKSLAFGPGLTQAKSLPKAPALSSHFKGRKRAGTNASDNHVRGAIDIVKGLEQKRLRRREKFYQNYYSRARKEKANHEKQRPPPGQGAERMREIGQLLMASKAGQGHYVISC